MKVLFKDVSLINAGKILKEWIEILNYHTDQFTSKSVTRVPGLETAEGYLLFALGQIGVDKVRMLNNTFSKVVEPKLKLLDKTRQYDESTYGIGRITTVLPFILPFENKPNPALLNDTNGGKDEVKRSLINIQIYSQKIISKVVLDFMKRNPSINLSSLPKRYKPFLELFTAGKTLSEIILALGLEDSDLLKKELGRMMYQFSFGRSPGKPKYIIESKMSILGEETFQKKVEEFCNFSLLHKVPFSRENKSLKRKYQELSFVKMFAKRWLNLDLEQRQKLLKALLLGKSSNIATLLETEETVVNTFKRNFEPWFLDEIPIDNIFEESSTNVVSENMEFYTKTINDIKALKLDYILPTSAEEIVSFMQNYLNLVRKGVSKTEITKELSKVFNYESSYVSILHQKASLLSDLVTIVKSNPKGLGQKIMEAWTMLDFVEKAQQSL